MYSSLSLCAYSLFFFAFYCSPESLQNALLFNTLVQGLYHESGDRELSLVSFHFKMYILACLTNVKAGHRRASFL